MANEELLTRDNIKALLREGVCEVVFIKANGERRVLRGTLKSSLLPEEHLPKGTGRATPPNLDVVKVFDLEGNAWRSFRLDRTESVTRVETEEYSHADPSGV